MRIRPEDKARLDRLQARYLLKRGKRLPLDAILQRMLRVAARHEDEVLEDDAPPRLSAKQRERLLALPYDFGMATDPDTIDEEIYGPEDT